MISMISYTKKDRNNSKSNVFFQMRQVFEQFVNQRPKIMQGKFSFFLITLNVVLILSMLIDIFENECETEC